MSQNPYDAASHALWSIMLECEGHRFGESGYDITLDHIYDCAVVAAEVIAHARDEETRACVASPREQTQ